MRLFAKSSVLTICFLFSFLLIHDAAADFIAADKGQAQTVIYAPGENEYAGLRLSNRILQWTGVSLPVNTLAIPFGDASFIAIGTPESNPVVKDVLAGDNRVNQLGEQGYLLKTADFKGRAVIIATGKTLAGVNNAVSELISWKFTLDKGSAKVYGSLDQSQSSPLKYRMIWNTMQSVWASTFEETVGAIDGGAVNKSSTKEGAIEYCKRAIDYCSDHKINGITLYYLINDEIGGLATAQEICRYARQNNVHIVLGVCTMTAYHGFASSPNFEFTFKNWNDLHPELRIVNQNGEFYEGICPSKPENQQWLRRGTRWLFTVLPDLGGVNVENGDWILCWCDECKAGRDDPNNDHNFFRDQMLTYKPVLDEMQKLKLDAWPTFAAYSGFTENAVKGAMYGATQSQRAKGPSTRITYPPKILKEMPSNSVCQWTLTGMVTPNAWPQGEKPPVSSFNDHLGFIHQNSPWWTTVDPNRWWADKAQGSMWDEIIDTVQFVTSRVHSTGMAGLTLQGMAGEQAPARDLGYIAFEYFSWNPERTTEQFVDERLSVHLGGSERARTFLKMIRNTTKNPAEIEQDLATAKTIAGQPDLEIRQQHRWNNLVSELNRRLELAKQMASIAELEKNTTRILPTMSQQGYITLSDKKVNTNKIDIVFGTVGGNSCVAIGIHTLPFGITAQDITEAKLRIPITNILASENSSISDAKLIVQHFDAANDQQVSLGDANSKPLALIGVYRQPGTLDPEPVFDQFVELDVTANVKADMAAQRTSFAWRIEPEALKAGSADSLLSFPATENPNGSYIKENCGATLTVKFQSITGKN